MRQKVLSLTSLSPLSWGLEITPPSQVGGYFISLIGDRSDPFLFLHQLSPHSVSIRVTCRACQTHTAGLHPQCHWFRDHRAQPSAPLLCPHKQGLSSFHAPLRFPFSMRQSLETSANIDPPLLFQISHSTQSGLVASKRGESTEWP